jgi:type IV pilus assembly protein PilM
MAEKVMTLYFEDTGIKLLVAKSRRAERWASVPLEPGLVVGGVIVDENQVANKVRELFGTIKQNKTANLIGGKGKLVVGLSGRDSLYRVVSLPVLADSLLGEAVRREAGRVLPVSLDELYLAYQRIPGNANETRVFVAAFPKKATDVLIRTLRLAGVTPRVLDLAPLALCLSVNEPRAIIADARLDSLNIMVMTDRVPQVIRSLVLQSEEKTISENMPTISEEFSRTVAFYNSSHQQEPLDENTPVFVSGDLSNLPDVWQALVGKLNSKVAVLPSVIEYPEDFPVSDYIINLGLVTKELALEKQPGNYSLVNLNALPAAALPKAINVYRIIVPVVAVAGIAGIVFLWSMWQTDKNDIKSLTSQKAATENQIISNTKTIAKLTEQNRLTQAQIQPIKDAANVFTTKLNTLETARFLTDSDVHQIVALKPQTVDVTGMAYSDTAMNVTGLSRTQAEVLSYAQALRDTGGFTVVVSSINYSSEITETGTVIPTYNFTFQMK